MALMFMILTMFLTAALKILFSEPGGAVFSGERIFGLVTGDGTALEYLRRHASFSYIAVMPLTAVGFLSVGEHLPLGPARFSRETLGSAAYRGFLSGAALIVGGSVALLLILTVAASLAAGRFMPSVPPAYLYALLWLIPALPWTVSIGLWLHAAPFSGARPAIGTVNFGFFLSLVVNMMSLTILAQWAVRHSIDARHQGIPIGVGLASLAALGAGLAALRLAFSYYYSRAALIT